MSLMELTMDELEVVTGGIVPNPPPPPAPAPGPTVSSPTTTTSGGQTIATCPAGTSVMVIMSGDVAMIGCADLD
jgi:hypothetical protein